MYIKFLKKIKDEEYEYNQLKYLSNYLMIKEKTKNVLRQIVIILLKSSINLRLDKSFILRYNKNIKSKGGGYYVG